MQEELFEKMKRYSKENNLNLNDPDPNVAHRNWLKAEAAVRRLNPELAHEPLGPSGPSGPAAAVNRSETENQINRLRLAAINSELAGKDPRHPLVYSKAERAAKEKHQLLFSDDPKNWQRAIQFSRSVLADETLNRVADGCISKGMRLAKITSLTDLAELAGISVNDLRLRFPGWTVSEIVDHLQRNQYLTF